ncbi:MAG: 16S rRNA (cytosine(967)-C(5))-methyltransferase RsmB [Pyrinomonadaceae bacterium]
MKISPARTAAFDVLLKIGNERAFSSVLLPQYEERLSPRDRSLCHQLTLGVLRRQMYLDRLIDHFSGGRKLDQAVRLSLRLGLYQLRFLDRVPGHSAVNESVDLVHRAKKSSARGFVNAVLRRAVREAFEPDYASDAERISIETSHPKWLIEKWADRFGLHQAELLAQANNELPAIAFRYTNNAADRAALEGVRSSKVVPGCFLADEFSPDIAQAAADGAIYLQDEGSQLVGYAVQVPENGTFLDVCAAPGSKATQIAADGNGRLFVAGDLHPHRTRFLLENARAQGVRNINVVQYEAELSLPFEKLSFDTVLVDAPCSGTGTIRHNPELRYFIQPDDLLELSDKQLRILTNASKMVRIGGSLIYSTCSLEAEENEAVANAFLASVNGFEKSAPNVPERFIGPDLFARTTPHIDGMDGFFIASFVRR